MAGEIGELLLKGRNLAIWRKALLARAQKEHEQAGELQNA